MMKHVVLDLVDGPVLPCAASVHARSGLLCAEVGWAGGGEICGRILVRA